MTRKDCARTRIITHFKEIVKLKDRELVLKNKEIVELNKLNNSYVKEIKQYKELLKQADREASGNDFVMGNM